MTTEADYVRNTIMYSGLTDRYFFVPKARRLAGSIFRVVGRKYDVTESMKAHLREARALTPKPKPAGKRVKR